MATRSPMKRLSLALRFNSASSYKPSVAPDPANLAQFLRSTRTKYFEDVQSQPSKGGEWVVSMGNEAGDLDSLASAIAFAWLRSTTGKEQSVPLVQTAREDLQLREENLYALELAGLKDPLAELTFVTDIVPGIPFPSHKFALVDHNRLGDKFSANNPTATVVAVVDHHEDEGLYKDTADPRVILPAGSCASHVALLCPPEMPAELATLLLCAILIDTDGLKPGGKALKTDHSAAEFLVPRSTFAQSVPGDFLDDPAGNKLWEAPAIKDLTKTLGAKKSDVSRLSALDLLRRDYKENSHVLAWAPGQPTIKAGMSTVPVGVKNWASKGRLLEPAEEWMKTQGLTVLGVLTSFRSDKKFGKSGKGKHRREQVWLIRDPAGGVVVANGDAGDAASGKVDLDVLADRLWKGLEASEKLQLKKHKDFQLASKGSKVPSYMRWKAYKQGDASATRKTTAPVLKAILEGAAPSDSSGPSDTAA
ncbi:hypothetical protein HGRIS_012469 [Hohenbuehelia grisea]|uniref:DHHA2 domain-containing protein n=1 Tax=Hohenbuehelia grisea TaxID=104357 RepID=A0ABR3ISB2_9AGAR